MRCEICSGNITRDGTWSSGHNARPVAQGRCCDECNRDTVIPARALELRMANGG